MTRGSVFGEMSYHRLTSLLSKQELVYARHNECGESVVRCCSFMQFCCVSLFSLVTVMTPWMLSAAELVIMLVLYFAVAPESVESFTDGSGITHDRFTSNKNLKDVLICSVIRVILLSVSYAFAFMRYRPYYAIAWITSLVLIPYAFVKAAVTEMKPVGPSVALILTLILFSIVHVIVAHTTMKRLQRRYNMGISGFDSPWDEDDWVMNGSFDTSNTQEAIQEMFLTEDDIPRDVLADADSKFIDCVELSVHYKEAYPQGDNADGATLDPTFAVLLIHGYGGGVFAWRHLMQPMAETCRCRVVAFDRPAFGLTARPKGDAAVSPYAFQSQQSLVLELCNKLGIKKAMLVAHSDGCILSLMLGAALNRLNASIPTRVSDTARKLLKTGSSKDIEGPLMISLPIRRAFSESRDANLSDVPEEDTVDLESQSTTMDAVLKPSRHHGLSILTMVFLHPDLSTDEAPSFSNLLRQSKIARSVLRPLLRSDIGEVSSRRAWYNHSKLTKEVLELYKAPLRIHGWDSALVAYTKERRAITNEDIKLLMQRVIGLPMLVVTGEKDRIVPPERAITIADELHAEHRSVLANCGHLSHEEVPEVLLDTLIVYVRQICELYEL